MHAALIAYIASCGDSVCDTDFDSSTCLDDCNSNVLHISLANIQTSNISDGGELFCWGLISSGQLVLLIQTLIERLFLHV